MADPGKPRIAVLLDHIESDYHVEVISGVLRAARSSRVKVLIVPGGWLSRSAAQPLARNFIYDFLAQARIDGVLALAGSLSNYSGLDRFTNWLDRFGHLPVVTVGIDVPGTPSVWVDNGVGIRAAIEHLVKGHGRRRIAFIRGPAASPEADARHKAYRLALEEHGISEDDRLVVPGGFSREDGAAGIRQLFDERRFSAATLNAVVAVNDDSALGALEELTRRGVTVPDPIAVVGFDDAESARAANPPLTTVSQRVELQAHTAATALFDAIAQKKPPVGKKLDPELVVRASCGCVFRFHNDSAEVRLTGSGMARSAALSLVERRSTIAAELARAAAGRLAGMSGWESRLIDALIHDLGHASDQSFVYEIEQFSRKNVALGRSVMVCHDVLTALRLQAVAATTLEPAARPRIEDLFQEARMRLARVGSEVEHERQQSLNHHVRTVTKACLNMVAGGDASELDDALSEHLPALGIKAYVVSRLEKTRAGEQFTLVARYAENTLSRTLLQVPARDLGIDPALEREETLVVEPLEFAGTPVGVAALAWGAHTPVHYESLREVLSAAIYALSRTGAALLQP